MSKDKNKSPRLNRRRVLQGVAASAVLLGAAGTARAGFLDAVKGLNIGGAPVGDMLGAAADLFEGLSLGEEDELRIGEALYPRLIAQSNGAYRNSRVQDAMKSFAAPLFKTSTRDAMKWDITVLNDDVPNAWALPGGKLAVNRGLVRYVANEHELAAVLSHEIGHVENAHAIKELRTKKATGALTDAGKAVIRTQAGAGGAITDQFIDAISPAITGLVTSGYSRGAEFEADHFILTSFEKTGYDPKQAPGFFRTLLELIPASQEGTTSLFSSHPVTKDRIAKLEEDAAGLSYAGKKSGDRDFAELRKSFPLRRYYRRHAV